MEALYFVALYKNGTYVRLERSGKNNTVATFTDLNTAKRFKSRVSKLYENDPQVEFAVIHAKELEVIG